MVLGISRDAQNEEAFLVQKRLRLDPSRSEQLSRREKGCTGHGKAQTAYAANQAEPAPLSVDEEPSTGGDYV
jgi:hypothetical protein